jgi:hypothetical protein
VATTFVGLVLGPERGLSAGIGAASVWIFSGAWEALSQPTV